MPSDNVHREMDSACSILLFVPSSAASAVVPEKFHPSRFPFRNVRLDQRVKRARLEQSGVKSTAGYTTMPVVLMLLIVTYA